MSHPAHIRSSEDVITFLKSQHEQIKALFGQVQSTRGDDRKQAFFELRRLLAVHETAEEIVVHPKAAKNITNGRAIVDERLAEERQAKEALVELEKMDVDAPEFEAAFTTLMTAVMAHAEAEETTEFAQLRAQMDADELHEMERAAEAAEKMAPTRPHPGVESGAMNMMAGPFAAMLDRARDAITRPGH